MTDDEARALFQRSVNDQTAAAFGQVATMVRGYFLALVATGFAAQQALFLASEYQRVMLKQ
jgi:hypothetical protein